MGLLWRFVSSLNDIGLKCDGPQTSMLPRRPSTMGLLFTASSMSQPKIPLALAASPVFELFSQPDYCHLLDLSTSTPLVDIKSERGASMSVLQRFSPSSDGTATFSGYPFDCICFTTQPARELPPSSSLASCSFPDLFLIARSTSDTLGSTSHHS